MDFLEQYLNRAQAIVGDRTIEEIRYDIEVVRWLRKGKNIRKAIDKANKKYPHEALRVDESNIHDVAAHYDFLLEHEDILPRITH